MIMSIFVDTDYKGIHMLYQIVIFNEVMAIFVENTSEGDNLPYTFDLFNLIIAIYVEAAAEGIKFLYEIQFLWNLIFIIAFEGFHEGYWNQ